MSPAPPTTPDEAQLQRRRARVPWVADSDLISLETRSPALTAALSLALPGAGQLYVGDIWRGVGLLAAALCALLVGGVLGVLAWGGVAVGAAVLGARQARRVTQYVKARHMIQGAAARALLPPPSSPLRLLTAMGHAATEGLQPTAVADAPPEVQSLYKLGALARDGLIDPLRYQERKLDLLTALAERPSASAEDTLSDLQPLLREGLIDGEDVTFVQRLLGL